MTNDAKLLTAAAELGRDRVLLDPTDDELVLAVEELSGVTISERWAARQVDGICRAYAIGETLSEEDDVAPTVRSVASVYGLC